MSFYFRQSVRLGLVRFNLSKSGIGVSAGIPGLRIGTSPRGNYIHVGRGGVYYRHTFAPQRSPRAGYTALPTIHAPSSWPHATPPATNPTIPNYHGAFQTIESGDATLMTDASAGTLLDELNGKRRRWRILPFVLFLPVACFLFLLLSQNLTSPSPSTVHFASGLFVLSVVAFVPLLVAAFLWDRRRFCVVMYSLDDQAMAAYQTLHNGFSALAASSVIWHVRAHAAVYDSKYSAGASTILDARPTRADKQEPPLVRINLESVSILASGGTRLSFFPDRLLVFGSQGVGAVNYRDLHIQSSETQFILDSSPPRDARVVDWTWQYVNRKGGPDRRFSHNPRKPIIHCERLQFTSTSGLNEVFQFSRPGVAAAFEHAVRQLTSTLNTLSMTPAPGANPPSVPPSQVPTVEETPRHIPPMVRTILALGAFGIIAFIASAMDAHKKNNANASASAPVAAVQSSAIPEAADAPVGPFVAVPVTPAPHNPPSSFAPTPTPVPVTAPTPSKADFNRLVAESQQRAVAAYPALRQLGSPINARFVNRYTALKAAASPRLKESDWPEKLARECAAELTHR